MTTQTREETARAFAEAMGWTILPWADPPTTLGMRGWVEFETRLPKLVQDNVRLPAPDAPLHEHLAFVGRVAQALGPVCHLVYVSTYGDTQWSVCFKPGTAMMEWRSGTGVAPDPSWAAMLASIEARKGR